MDFQTKCRILRVPEPNNSQDRQKVSFLAKMSENDQKTGDLGRSFGPEEGSEMPENR